MRAPARKATSRRETVYGDDPVAVARRWGRCGRALAARRRPRRRAGRPAGEGRRSCAAICAAVRMPVQVGGGLRDAAASQARARRRRCARRPRHRRGARAGSVRRRSAARSRAGSPSASTRATAWSPSRAGSKSGGDRRRDGRARGARLRARRPIIYTDIGRDGTAAGPDLDGTRAVARAAGIPVIASGGVGTLDALRARRGAGGRRRRRASSSGARSTPAPSTCADALAAGSHAGARGSSPVSTSRRAAW